MQPKGTSKEPLLFFKLSTWIIIISSCIAVVSMFLLVYPLAATPLFPHVSLFRRKALCCVHHRDFPLVDVVMGCRCVHAIYYSHHRVSPDLSEMASPTLVGDPSDTACRVVEVQPTGCMAWQPTGKLFVCMYV